MPQMLQGRRPRARTRGRVARRACVRTLQCHPSVAGVDPALISGICALKRPWQPELSVGGRERPPAAHPCLPLPPEPGPPRGVLSARS